MGVWAATARVVVAHETHVTCSPRDASCRRRAHARRCGLREEDVERGVGQGSEQIEESGRDAEKAGEDAAGEAKEGAEELEREAEK